MIRAIAALLLLATTASAQTPAADRARLEPRLGAATTARILPLIDEARRNGLPAGTLVSTALEGAARGVDATRIVHAVEAQVAALERARSVLGTRSSQAEIVAGATAIRARVPPDSLARLRAARSGSALIPLVVASDLVARGVAPEDAVGRVILAVRRGARDDELVRMRERVAQDIAAGATPGEAVQARTQSLLLERRVGAPTEAPVSPPRPGASP